jgi:amidase
MKCKRTTRHCDLCTGLPIAQKDLLETRDIRTTFGSPLYKDYIPTEDDIVVDRMGRAGAITIGKTNTPEFGAGSQTFNKVFAATYNPYGRHEDLWRILRRCGRRVSLRFDGDCQWLRYRGVATQSCRVLQRGGFRPSIGRVPDPKASFAWSTLSTKGSLGRSVADLAFVLSRIAEPDSRAPLSIDEAGERFARRLDRSFKGVRVAWFKELGGVPFEPRVRAVVDGQRKTFESLGCIVGQAEPDFAPAEIAFRILRAWNSANTYGARLHEHPDAFKETLKSEIEEGLRLTGADVARAETAHGQLWRRFQALLEKYEYFVLPTTQLPPFDVNQPYPTEIAGVTLDNYIDWMKFCLYISATGNPSSEVDSHLPFYARALHVGVQPRDN